jgi:hypothetical protein
MTRCPLSPLRLVKFCSSPRAERIALGRTNHGREVAGVKVYMTNPHEGYAGPKVGYTTHVNFHVDNLRSGSYAELVNLHITRYTAGGRECLYMWDEWISSFYG